MAVINYTDITLVRILPIHSLSVVYPGVSGNSYNLELPAADSTWAWEEIVDGPGRSGEERVVGYQFTADLNFPYDAYGAMAATFLDWQNKIPESLFLRLKPLAGQQKGATLDIQVYDSGLVELIDLHPLRVRLQGGGGDAGGMIPRLNIRIKAFYSLDIMTITDSGKPFNPVAGF